MVTRETLSLGSSANDGTGDTLRSAGAKINNNFAKVFVGLGVETLTTSGAANVDSDGYTILNSGTSLAVTLADPATTGSMKTFTNAGAGLATITPTNFAQGTSFSLAQYAGCTTIWDGSNWYITGAYPNSDLTIA
mgnify:FL=1